MKDYRLTFPDYVQSISLTQNDLGNFADITAGGQVIGINTEMQYYADPTTSTFSADVVKGDGVGSTLTTTLSKTWSYDGKDPTGGTKVHAELKLHLGFFQQLAVSDESAKFGLQNALDKISDRAKTLEQSSPPQTILQTQPQPTSLQTTPPLQTPSSTKTPQPPTPTTTNIPKSTQSIIPQPPSASTPPNTQPITPQPTPLPPKSTPPATSEPLKVDGTDYSLSYTITNGKVLDMKIDTKSVSLIITIQTTGDGLLTVDIPRTLIDAKSPSGQDDQFYVLDGSKEIPFQESKTGTERTLSISFLNGDRIISIIGTNILTQNVDSNFPLIDGIPCETKEYGTFHIHAHLDIFVDGHYYPVPALIGIEDNTCLYWLHTHSTDGIIHIESPLIQDFTLGQFIDVWKSSSSTSTPSGVPTIYINGQVVSTSLADTKLNAHDEIVLVYGSPPPNIPSFYQFAAGL